MATKPDSQTPRSVRNLQHQAQISHRDVLPPEDLMLAITRPDSPARRRIAAQAIQEAEIPDLAELLVDEVVNGTQLHALLTRLAREGEIRRPDLIDWSTRFS